MLLYYLTFPENRGVFFCKAMHDTVCKSAKIEHDSAEEENFIFFREKSLRVRATLLRIIQHTTRLVKIYSILFIDNFFQTLLTIFLKWRINIEINFSRRTNSLSFS